MRAGTMDGAVAGDTLTADYVVIGAGAVGMAFVDAILSESDVSVALVDMRDAPGGHWNDAYPFIGLHAPSIFYGVPSRPLGCDETETIGLNAGHRALATKPEIMDYYRTLLHDRFLASGRVQWLPKHAFETATDGTDRLRSLVTGQIRTVRARHRLVDATRSDIQVPATHQPAYEIDPGVAVIAPNDLVDMAEPPTRFCVVGSGKTGMDTCLWLLTHDVDPSRIRWIKPRESLVLDREVTRDFDSFARTLIGQMQAVAAASSFDDFIARLGAFGMAQIDAGVPATQFRGAMLARREIDALRTIKDVVRLGHVTTVEPMRIVLADGSIGAEPGTLYIDCTAYGHHERGPVPVFEDGRINLQLVRASEPLFSAAFIAFVETLPMADAERNAVCGPVLLPSTSGDILRMMKLTLDNIGRWMAHPELMQWAAACRLDMLHALDSRRAQDPADPLMQAFGAAAAAATPRLPALIAEATATGL